jgi:hypothetical protein
MPESDIALALDLDSLAEDLAARPVDTDIRERAKELLARIKEMRFAASDEAVRDLNEWLNRIVYWTPSHDALCLMNTSEALVQWSNRFHTE